MLGDLQSCISSDSVKCFGPDCFQTLLQGLHLSDHSDDACTSYCYINAVVLCWSKASVCIHGESVTFLVCVQRGRKQKFSGRVNAIC